MNEEYELPEVIITPKFKDNFRRLSPEEANDIRNWRVNYTTWKEQNPELAAFIEQRNKNKLNRLKSIIKAPFLMAPYFSSAGVPLALAEGTSRVLEGDKGGYGEIALTAVPALAATPINKAALWTLKKLPGFLIKSLFENSKLLQLTSKQGTLSVNNIQSWINKADTPEIDKYLLTEVLNKHLGEKFIDANLLRLEVQNLIPKYNRVPLTGYSDYGMYRLGFNLRTVKRKESANAIKLNTFSFESPGIIGDIKHYRGNPIGHSRTYTTVDEPNVLHVMESQSDWALNVYKGKLKPVQFNEIRFNEATGLFENPNPVEFLQYSPIQSRMINTYTQRQLQENLRYAAENGLTKMRYPTPETAATIEGFKKETPYSVTALAGEDILELSELLTAGRIDLAEYDWRVERINNWMNSYEKAYSPEHQTILNKYSDFPKQFQKLFGKLTPVRTVTDPKGNTWFEVDVPLNYLLSEMLFKSGGKLIPRCQISLNK